MRTKRETIDYLNSLMWQRFTKSELLEELNKFFSVSKGGFEDGTDPENKDLDYSLLYTTEEVERDNNFIDIEIFYAKARKRNGIIVTGVELLDYYYE